MISFISYLFIFDIYLIIIQKKTFEKLEFLKVYSFFFQIYMFLKIVLKIFNYINLATCDVKTYVHINFFLLAIFSNHEKTMFS